MELRLIHFYPDLMSLYGSCGNIAVLRRYMERLGNAVTVEAVPLGGEADLSGADFIFMGVGTERAARAARSVPTPIKMKSAPDKSASPPRGTASTVTAFPRRSIYRRRTAMLPQLP